MQTSFKLYKVSIKYIRNLHRIDDKVLSVSPQTGKNNRVFVGIILVCGHHKYCIPLSSPKEKHKKMRDSLDFMKIEKDGKLIGVLNINLMIPVSDIVLEPVDITIHKRDRNPIKHYKALCNSELEWCNKHSEIICNKANILYMQCIKNGNYKGKKRCVDFKRLEAECMSYCVKARNCD